MAKRPALTSLENDLEPYASPPATCYQWYTTTDLLDERQKKTEERRRQILEAIYEEDQHVSVSEWLALQSERDQLLRLSIEKENELYKKEFVRDLRRVLNDIPAFSSSSEDQDIFDSVVNLKGKLKDYSKNNEILSPTPCKPFVSLPPKIELSPHFQSHSEKEDFALPREETVSLPPPCPPPPIPIMNASGINPVLQGSKGTHKKVNFLTEIATHQKGTLRHVNIPRTPGGTPKRPKHWINATGGSHCDILQRALLKKFHNAHIHSTPNENNVSESGSLNLSNAWSDRASDECHFASDPDLTHISTDPFNPDVDTESVLKDPSFSSSSVRSPGLALSSQMHYSTSV